jgi:hypothetical protein
MYTGRWTNPIVDPDLKIYTSQKWWLRYRTGVLVWPKALGTECQCGGVLSSYHIVWECTGSEIPDAKLMEYLTNDGEYANLTVSWTEEERHFWSDISRNDEERKLFGRFVRERTLNWEKYHGNKAAVLRVVPPDQKYNPHPRNKSYGILCDTWYLGNRAGSQFSGPDEGDWNREEREENAIWMEYAVTKIKKGVNAERTKEPMGNVNRGVQVRHVTPPPLVTIQTSSPILAPSSPQTDPGWQLSPIQDIGDKIKVIDRKAPEVYCSSPSMVERHLLGMQLLTTIFSDDEDIIEGSQLGRNDLHNVLIHEGELSYKSDGSLQSLKHIPPPDPDPDITDGEQPPGDNGTPSEPSTAFLTAPSFILAEHTDNIP